MKSHVLLAVGLVTSQTKTAPNPCIINRLAGGEVLGLTRNGPVNYRLPHSEVHDNRMPAH